jgi:hypothetical protein
MAGCATHRCLQAPSDSDDFQARPVRAAAAAQKPPQQKQLQQPQRRLEVPPKLAFSMLSGRDLQAKLRALRLPAEGKRQVSACALLAHRYAAQDACMPPLTQAALP